MLPVEGFNEPGSSDLQGLQALTDTEEENVAKRKKPQP